MAKGSYKIKIFAFLTFYINNFVLARPELSPSSPYQYNGTPSIQTSSTQSSYLPSSSSSSLPSSSLNLQQASPSYGPPPQTPIIHKHVYVHVSPMEPEYQSPRKPIVLPPPQKHYKIVFIKAPSPPIPTAPVIPIIPQNEEKTLVYILVKKPDEQPDIIIPTPAPTQPNKPEVYFIRYKTQKQQPQQESNGGGSYQNSIAPAGSGDYGNTAQQLDHS